MKYPTLVKTICSIFQQVSFSSKVQSLLNKIHSMLHKQGLIVYQFRI